MVQNIIQLEDHIDRVLNMVKAKYGLKTKSEAIALVTKAYEQDRLEPELRPEYIAKIQATKRGKFIKIGTVEDFEQRYK